MRASVALRMLASFCVALVFTLLAAQVDAQRRGGGGRGGGGRGGGGRSIQRSGPAMGGSMRPSRGGAGGGMNSRPTSSASTRPAPSTRPSTQPSRPATQPARPSTQPARPGAGGAGTQQRPQQRPGQGGTGTNRPGEGNRPDRGDNTENREDWQNWADERQDDRQKFTNNAMEDRQDFYEENGGAYYYGGGWGYGHGHYMVIDDDSDNDWAVLVAGLVVGSTLTAAAFSSMQQSTSCTLSETTVNGVRYYRCGKTWYSRVMDGSNVNYVVVSPPAGY